MASSAGETNLAASAAQEPLTGTEVSLSTHWIILIGCAVVVILAMTMSIRGHEKVSLPGMGSPLPELCHLKRVFNVPCPGCGLTRSFISMGHFDLVSAAGYNVAGVPLFLLTLAQIPYRAYWLFQRNKRRMTLRGFRFEGGVLIGLAGLMVIQWAARLAWERFF